MSKKFLLKGIRRMISMMLFTFMTTSTHAADGDTLFAKTIEHIELTYQVISETDRTCRVVRSETTQAIIGEVTIPNSVDNYSVVDIYYSAFALCKDLTSVNVPNTVKRIYEGAFYGCTNLTSITLPHSLTFIGERTFENCSSLTSISLPDSVKSIGSYAFANCVGLTSVHIPNSVNSLGDYAFSRCTRLTSFTIPNSLTHIRERLFEDCISLTSISIPNSVTHIGLYAFEGCTSLSSIIIPNSVASIEGGAFYGCTSLTSISLPDSMKSIEGYLFHGCKSLSSITLPDSIKEIGYFAFYDCSSLTSVTIPNSITSIGESAFQYCISLTSITLPDSIRGIDGNLFLGCKNLKEINIPDLVTYIGSYAFAMCTNLNSITIPASVVELGESAFYGCDNIKKVTSCIVRPFAVLKTAFSPFNSSKDATLKVPYGTKCLYENTDGWKDFSTIVEMEIESYNATFTVSPTENVEITFQILDRDRHYCRIGDGSNTAIISPSTLHLTIPGTVNDFTVISVAENAFSGLSSLIDISFPETIIVLSDQMFKDCSSLAAIQWNADAPLPSSAMEGITNPNLLLYVKDKDYAPSGNWNVVANGVAGDIVLSEAAEGNNFYCPKEFTANSIEYTHNYSMTSGYHTCQGWETIALPFDVTNVYYETYVEMIPITNWKKESHQRPFWLYEQTNEGWQAATTIKANTPYIICMPNNPENYESTYNINGNVVFKAANAKVLESNNISNVKYGERLFVPNFLNQAADNRIYAMNVTNQWFNSSDELPGSKFVANLRDVHPFEAYMMVEGASKPAYIPIFEDGIHTDILILANRDKDSSNPIVYDLSGRKVEIPSHGKLPEGIYIRNNRKVLIK